MASPILNPQSRRPRLSSASRAICFPALCLWHYRTGLLAYPVLAGSGAYALAELMEWEEGLEHKFYRAKAFYVVIALSVIVD